MSENKKWTRRAALGCLATGTGLFAAESAGYTAVSADRRSVLGTVDDDSALLKLTKTSGNKIEGDSGDVIILTELISRFGTPLRLDNVEIADVSWINLKDLPDTIGTSESDSGIIKAKLKCSSDKTEDIQITIEASSDDQQIKLDRELTVKCYKLRPSGCPVSVSAEDSRDASELSKSSDINVNREAINGKIETDESIVIKNNSTVDGSLDAGGSIVVKNNSTVGGSLDAGGSITIQKSKIGGNVTAGGAVDIKGSQGGGSSGGPSLVCGSISAEGNVDIQNADVSDITSEDSVFIKSNATVFGDIGSSENRVGSVTVNGTVKGSVYSSGSVTINGTVKGSVYSSGDVTGSGSIEGNDPWTDRNNE